MTNFSCTKCDTNIIDIKRKRLNSQQYCSSLPSLQSRSPSHRSHNGMHWPLLHRNVLPKHLFNAKRYNVMNHHQWFCAYSYRINLIEMVSVIEFTRIYHHAVMQTLLNFVKIYLAFIDRVSHDDDLIFRAH